MKAHKIYKLFKNILVVCNAFHHHYSSNNAHPFVSAFGNERFKFKQKLINLTLFLWHFHAEINVHNTSACNCMVLNLFQNKHLYQIYYRIQNPYFFQSSYNVLQKYVSLTLGYHWTVVFLL